MRYGEREREREREREKETEVRRVEYKEGEGGVAYLSRCSEKQSLH